MRHTMTGKRQLETGDRLHTYIGLGILDTELIRVEADSESEARHRINGLLAAYPQELQMWIHAGCQTREEYITI